VFPKSRTEAVVNALPAEVQLHPKQFTHVLSIARERGRYYYGLAPKELFWCVCVRACVCVCCACVCVRVRWLIDLRRDR
jgi:hypothetical protein